MEDRPQLRDIPILHWYRRASDAKWMPGVHLRSALLAGLFLGKGWCSRSSRMEMTASKFLGYFSYTARFDGKPYDLKNSRDDIVQLQLVNAHTLDSIYRRDNQVTQRDSCVVSADGRQMMLTTTGALETRQHATEKLVFQKQ